MFLQECLGIIPAAWHLHLYHAQDGISLGFNVPRTVCDCTEHPSGLIVHPSVIHVPGHVKQASHPGTVRTGKAPVRPAGHNCPVIRFLSAHVRHAEGSTEQDCSRS